MVKELKNKLKVSDDALGWVMEWSGGRLPGLPIGDLRDQEISQVYVSATAGSRRREREARGRGGERGEESSLQAEAGFVSLGPAQRRAGPPCDDTGRWAGGWG